MKGEDDIKTVEAALEMILREQGGTARRRPDGFTAFKRLVIADFKRIQAGRAAFHRHAGGGECTIKVTAGCSTLSPGLASNQAPHVHDRASAADTAAALARQAGNDRAPIGWGGGHCSTYKNCWVCIEWECS